MQSDSDVFRKAMGLDKEETPKVIIKREKWTYERLLQEVIEFKDFEKIPDATTRNHAQKVQQVLKVFSNNTNFQSYRIKAVIKIIEIIINKRKK